MGYFGIDISKGKLDCYCLETRTWWSEDNAAAGHEMLVSRLAKAQRVVVEATGGYEKALVRSLRKAGIEVLVVNPRWTKRFGQALGHLAKSDQLDAKVLAQYAAVVERSQVVCDASQERLKALNAHRQDLVEQITATSNRAKQSEDAFIEQHLKELQSKLKELLKSVESEIACWVEAHPVLKAKAALLSEVKGVGPVLSAMLLSEVPELGQVDRWKVAALAGLAPFTCDSGLMKGKRRIWGGRKTIRTALYMATLSACRTDPELKAHYQKLRANGKAFKVALVACMRKRLVQLNAKMRDAFYSPAA